MPEGDGKVSWNAQITIGTLGGNVIGADDIAKVMGAAQDTFSTSGAAILEQPQRRERHRARAAAQEGGHRRRREGAQERRAGEARVVRRVGVKGDKTGGYSGAVTLTWVF